MNIVRLIVLICALCCVCCNRKGNVIHNSEVFISDSGLIFIEGKIKDSIGYFLFDTGSELSIIRSRYLCQENSKELRRIKINDSFGSTKNAKLVKLEGINLGSLTIETNNYAIIEGNFFNVLDDEIKSINGEVLGVLGLDIASNFNWDFDFLNKKVSISTCLKMLESDLCGELIINKRDDGFYTPLEVNDSIVNFLIDTGCNIPFELKGKLPGDSQFIISGIKLKNHSMVSAFADDKLGKADLGFIDVKAGNYTLTNSLCSLDRGFNVMGVPVFHNFSRVRLDFTSGHVFFYNEMVDEIKYSSVSMSQERINKAIKKSLMLTGAAHITIRDSIFYPIKMISQKVDTTDSNLTIYNSYSIQLFDNRTINLVVKDSLRLPNGRILKEGSIISITDGIWSE